MPGACVWTTRWLRFDGSSINRVSTDRQGHSGLDLETQRAQVEAMASERGAEISAEYVEVESSRKSDRPQLAAALAH